MAVSNYFDTLTDTEFVMDAAVVLAAYLAPGLVGPMVGQFVPVDVPSEAYGIAEIVGAEATMGGSNKVLVQYGGAIYTLEQLMERFGLQQALEDMGGN